MQHWYIIALQLTKAYPLDIVSFNVNSNSMFVGDFWKNEISEYEQNASGDWKKVSVVALPGDDRSSVAAKMQSSKETVLVSVNREYFEPETGGYRTQTDLQIYRRNNNSWISENTIPLTSLQYILDKSGDSILILNEDADHFDLHRRSESGNWVVSEVPLPNDAINDSSKRFTCFGPNRFTYDNLIFERDAAGDHWNAAKRLPKQPFSATPDCTTLVWLDEDLIFVLNPDGSTSSPVTDSSVGLRTVNNAVISEEYLVLLSTDDNQESESKLPQLTVYSDTNANGWEFLGYVPVLAEQQFIEKPWNIDLAIENSTLFVGNNDPGSITIYDLDQITLETNPPEAKNFCRYGYSDPDGDQFGWENNQVCVYPDHYIEGSDPRVNETLSIDTTYPQLPAEPLLIYNDHALVFGDEQLFIYTNTGDSWMESARIDLIEDYMEQLPSRNFNNYEVDYRRLTAAMDENNIAIGFTLDLASSSDPAISNTGDVYSSNVITYKLVDISWIVSDFLHGLDHANLWEQFGNSMVLQSGDLIINSSASNYVGDNGAGLYVFWQTETGTWEQAGSFIDRRQFGQPGGKMGYSMSSNDRELFTTNSKSGLQSSMVEIYEIASNGQLTPQQTISTSAGIGGGSYQSPRIQNVPNPGLLSSNNNLAIDDGGSLRLFSKENGSWLETIAFTGGSFLIHANKLWKVDPPLTQSLYDSGDIWRSDRSYYPAIITESNQTASSEDVGDNSGSGSIDNFIFALLGLITFIRISITHYRLPIVNYKMRST